MFKKILSMLPVLVLAQIAGAQTTQPAAPPAGATVLFDGTPESLSKNWTNRNGKPATWEVAGSEMTSKDMDIITKEKFKDFQLHVEFNEPQLPDNVQGESRGNSGVYLQGRYEIQVLDSYGRTKFGKGDCGAIYNQKAPDLNANLPPGEWQTYDITFTAAKYGADGKKTAKARCTVILNGKKVQDDIEINGTTGSEIMKESDKPGPVMLQYHHNSIRFRNVWIVPATDK